MSAITLKQLGREGSLPRRLHFGCGDKHLAGWLNVDGVDGPAVDALMDLHFECVHLPTDQFDEVYSSHVVEHLYPDILPKVLRELRRSMREGAVIRIATIDLPGIFYNRYKTPANGTAWNSALYGETRSADHPFAAHRQCFTQASLMTLLAEAGFRDVKPWKIGDRPELAALNDYAKSCELVTCFAEGRK